MTHGLAVGRNDAVSGNGIDLEEDARSAADPADHVVLEQSNRAGVVPVLAEGSGNGRQWGISHQRVRVLARTRRLGAL